MGIVMYARNWWVVRRQDMAMASLPSLLNPPNYSAQFTRKQCSQDGMKAGAKTVAIACIASAISVLIGLRAIPWARVNLNYATQAHIISLATGAAYFTIADRTILASAGKRSFEKLANHMKPFL
ncbi:early nodulin-93 [Cryptomeria japonica]|uniref:early nodulin-93 n=1 Tax=Cryptomeria japonica TaxID=3369 RepID=UPI0027DA21DB|nr:early nodulin-93 [Cryptomeria japonica]